MTFLLLFSYVVLCDFFPLYEFVCIPGLGEPTESNTPLKDMVEQVSMNLNKTEDAVIRYYGSQKHDQPTASEILLDVWIFTLICEEIRQVKIEKIFSNCLSIEFIDSCDGSSIVLWKNLVVFCYFLE